MTTLSVVIPAYNEERCISDIINRVLSVKDNLKSVGVCDLQVLVVDDGSRDQTARIANEIAAENKSVHLIRHPKNKGYGAALKTGFCQAQSELIGFIDADGTYPPEYFPQLCQLAIDGKDLIIASRMTGTDSKMPITRRIGNIFFANLLSLLGRQRITDCASGMRVFKREVLEHIYPLPDGLNLTPVMSTRALHEGIKMAEIPIPYSERVGHSKLSVFRDGSVFLQSMIWTVLTYNPVRILGMIGLAGIVIAGLVLAGLVAARLSGITSLSPWGVAFLFASLVCGVTGVSIFALGITFNYLVSLFYKRPIRQGLFGQPIFNPSIDHHFGWLGMLGVIGGLILALISLALSIGGWEIGRLWLYLLGSAMLILTGTQLVIYWILLRVLDELSHREKLVENDLNPALSNL